MSGASLTSDAALTLLAVATDPAAPPLSRGLLLGAAIVLIGGIGSLFFLRNRQLERRIYWTSWIAGGAMLALALQHRGWGLAVAAFAASMFGAVFYAYMRTSYLKIGSKIYAFSVPDSQPDPPQDEHREAAPAVPARDSYLGVVSARNFWWLVVFLNCALAYGVFVFGWRWQTIAYTVGFAAFAALCGLDDATRRLPIVRGQRVQAVIATVASLLLWVVPPVVYLLGYTLGKRYPMGYGLSDPITRHQRPDDAGQDRE